MTRFNYDDIRSYALADGDERRLLESQFLSNRRHRHQQEPAAERYEQLAARITRAVKIVAGFRSATDSVDVRIMIVR